MSFLEAIILGFGFTVGGLCAVIIIAAVAFALCLILDNRVEKGEPETCNPPVTYGKVEGWPLTIMPGRFYRRPDLLTGKL